MSNEQQNKEVVHRLIEHGVKAAKTNPAALQEYFTDDYVNHSPAHHESGADEGLDAVTDVVSDAHQAADFEMKVKHMAAEGDWVFSHWEITGVHHSKHQKHRNLRHAEPVGQNYRIAGVFVHRMRDGKIAESWYYDNSASLALQQMATKTK
jgi:predicted SnoaL-like aldol condensation-catalyzing enzyme